MADNREFAVIACAVVTVIVVIVCALMALSRTMPSGAPEPVCETESCALHARLLTKDLDPNLDPCENFSAYVCSGWYKRQRTDYLHFSKSTMDDVRKSWFPAFHDTLFEGSQKLRAGRKPVAMYSSCMGSPSEYGSNLGMFRTYMDAVNLSWPEAPKKPGSDALSVLLKLAFQWQVPLWVRIREARSARSWRFAIDPAPFLPLMRQHHLSTTEGAYSMYWESFYRLLSLHQRKIDPSTVEALRTMEREVLEKLYAARTPQIRHPAVVPVSNMGNRTAPLTSDRWLRALEHLSLHPTAAPNDMVLLSDTGFFETLGSLFARYSNDQLLDLIGWAFVQLCAAAADYRLLVARYGSETAVAKYKPYFCERFVESSYSLLVIAMYSVARLSRPQRESVDAGFDSLVWAAATLANATTWMDEDSRRLTAEKMASTRLMLWPPDEYLDNDTLLEELYEAFPSAGQSFADYWVTASHVTAAAYRSLVNAGAFGYAVNYALPYNHYDGPLGKVKLAVGAVSKPLYYAGGTKAMFYGGLGFLMALSLVQAVDSGGLRWHPDGTFGDSFLSRDSTTAFADKDACLDSAKDAGPSDAARSVFPEIPALEVAHAAYRTAVAESSRPQNLVGGLRGDQVFFMTLCFMTCSREPVVDCNKAVSNFAPFARAFACPSGSPMNPERKCSFFG
ncbi:endothelin-converting enzyme 1-like [Dermacentor andersoni]|uniref:endothelin-converting enzyme 1-like n=1 Tax=Dermacentor andersoni TaxID=34620 RepID=UPI002416C063|nr:endothelin-converting enzyme 2-like [Dermacentor andersoni]